MNEESAVRWEFRCDRAAFKRGFSDGFICLITYGEASLFVQHMVTQSALRENKGTEIRCTSTGHFNIFLCVKNDRRSNQ